MGGTAAVVFDCDGLLVDTAAAWERAERQVVAAHGGEWTTGTRRKVHGLGIAAAAAVMARHVTDATGADVVLDEMLAAYADLVGSGLAPMPGAVALLDDLAGRLPLAVASNSPVH